MAGPSRIAAALDYLERLKAQADQASTQTQLQAAKVARDFAGGVGQNLANRARDLGQIGYEAFTSAPATPQTTAEFAELASQRQPTPMLDATAQGLGQFGKALVTDPVGTGRAMISGELERARTASTSPAAAGEYAGSFIDPMRIAKALRAAPSVRELIVHHGTPHTFEPTEANPLGEFDASKIGTGEGAQAYGHGHYLAESEKTGENYAYKLTDVGGGPVVMDYSSLIPRPRYGSVADGLYYRMKYLNDLKERAAAGDINAKNSIPAMEQSIKELKGKANVYKVDLPDEMIDRMLDWDKPLSEQSESVKQTLMKDKRIKSLFERGKIDDMYANGGEYYRSLVSQHRQNAPPHLTEETAENWAQPATSQVLKELGIPGIKYLDAGSRGATGTGARNFVVFPGEEKKVKILERK